MEVKSYFLISFNVISYFLDYFYYFFKSFFNLSLELNFLEYFTF